MPRRNRSTNRRRKYLAPWLIDETETSSPTTDDMAAQLVDRGLASPGILTPNKLGGTSPRRPR